MKPNPFLVLFLCTALTGYGFATDVPLESESATSAVFAATDQFGIVRLEVTRFRETQVAPGNVIVVPRGGSEMLIASQHQFFKPEFRVVHIHDDGSTTPFPNEELSRFDPANPLSFDTILGLVWDGEDTIWFLDNAMREKTTPKLVAWDMQRGSVSRVIYLPQPITRPDSFLNDVVYWLSPDGGEFLIIADPTTGTNGALIVVDAATGIGRRVLQGHSSVSPESGVTLAVDAVELQMKTPDGTIIKPVVGVNPIAVVEEGGGWVYLGPMSGTMLYRVSADMLCNMQMPLSEVSKAVEEVGPRPVSDGMAVMEGGRHAWFSDFSRNALTMVDLKRKQECTFSHPMLSFPSDFARFENGDLLVVANQLQLAPPFNGGENKTQPPFLLLRCSVMIEE